MKMMWPREVKVFWDPWRNIPLIKPKQEEIDLLYQLRLTEPGDARPAFRYDLERLRAAMQFEFGDNRVYSKFVEGKFVLLNKVPHWDVMYEVVSSGNVIGQLYYDPFALTWRFRLTHEGAYLALQQNLVETVVADPPIHSGRTLGSQVGLSARQVVILDRRGVIRGVGEVSSSGVVVTKSFHERSLPVECSEKHATVEDVIKHNDEGLEAMVERSTNYLRRLKQRYNTAVVVSYSGGKDSLVALDLTCRALGDIELIFNDTGLELPDTISNVERVANYYGCKLNVASAGNAFWRGVEIFGPPGRDYRWCCKVAKLVPIARLTKARWPTGALNVVGQRAYESINRAKSPLIWRNKWIPHMISTTPIQYWSQLACWLYILKYRLPYNRLYEEGFDRLGCYLCPSCALAEYQDVKRLYPHLWGQWSSLLSEWKRRLDMPDEWVELGLWRWLSPSTAKLRIIRNLPGYASDWKKEYINRLRSSALGLTPLHVRVSGSTLCVEFNEDVLPARAVESFIENALKLGFEVLSRSPLALKWGESVFEILGSTIRCESTSERTLDRLIDLLKLLYRSRGCALCGSCVLWTRSGSVRLGPSGPVLQRKLEAEEVKSFIEVCPISDQLVERVVAPVITGSTRRLSKRPQRAKS